MRHALELTSYPEAKMVKRLLDEIHRKPFTVVKCGALNAMGEATPYWLIEKGRARELVAEDEDPRKVQHHD